MDRPCWGRVRTYDLESLAPTIETLREAVVTLSLVVNPLSNIAERIPLPGRRHWPFRDDDE